MLFPYWPVDRAGERRWLPQVSLLIHGPKLTVDIPTLVDTGAEHNVISSDLAGLLGISLEEGRPVTVVGIGGEQIRGRLLKVDLQLRDERWSASTIFAGIGNGRAVLGHAGFFDHFNVTFRYTKREIEIKRAGG